MSDKKSGAVSAAVETRGYNFGTFAGVYTPALLTILGLVMFMRTNFVLGNAGLINMLIILAVGSSISLVTALSISAIATNTEVRGGGAYYLISRVLGPCFGTAIGITLFLTQSMAIPFNIIGASEALIVQWPELRSYFPLLNLGLGALLLLLVWFGSDWSIRAEYVIMVIQMVAVAFFLLGPIGDFSWANLVENLAPAEGVGSMIPLFAIFFPAVTGIMAGVNMSGDLKSPHRSIPFGTLAALGSAVVLYLIQIVLAAGCFSREEMISAPYGILVENALWGFGFVILAGVQATTLSTALSWMLGAPRVLQSLGADRVLPGFGFFQKTGGPKNEPRRALFAVLLLITPILLWTGFIGRDVVEIDDSPLNIMSRLVSLFFLFANAIINLAAFVESRGANPSFRPRFRFFHWSVAAYGAVACTIAAFLIDVWLSLAAVVVIGGLYLWTRYRNPGKMRYGDARHGFVYSRIQANLLLLQQLPLHPKNWRPTIMILTITPEKRGDILEYAMLVSQHRGILSVIQVIIQPPGQDFCELRAKRLVELRAIFKERNWEVLPTVVVAPEFDTALQTILQSHSLDPILPNIVMMGWPRQRERVSTFFRQIQLIVNGFRRNALILANASTCFVPRQDDGGTIDIWWKTPEGGSLMTILGYLVQHNHEWRRSRLRIFIMGSEAEAGYLNLILERARIAAEIVQIDPAEKLHIMFRRHSYNAELIFIEFNEYDLRDERLQTASHYLVGRMLRDMPPCFLAVSSGEADLMA